MINTETLGRDVHRTLCWAYKNYYSLLYFGLLHFGNNY